MPKRSRKTTKPGTRKPQPKRDENQMAYDTLQQLIEKGESEGKNPMAVALGRLGGLKGGHARAAKLTDEQRRASARKAAQARWQRKTVK